MPDPRQTSFSAQVERITQEIRLLSEQYPEVEQLELGELCTELERRISRLEEPPSDGAGERGRVDGGVSERKV